MRLCAREMCWSRSVQYCIIIHDILIQFFFSPMMRICHQLTYRRKTSMAEGGVPVQDEEKELIHKKRGSFKIAVNSWLNCYHFVFLLKVRITFFGSVFVFARLTRLYADATCGHKWQCLNDATVFSYHHLYRCCKKNTMHYYNIGLGLYHHSYAE